MVTITLDYQGEMHCQAVHGPSGNAIQTDAPLDNQGKGEAFSPTDLVAAALGSCMLTVMGMKAQSLGIELSGASAQVVKEMSAAPRRIARLAVTITVPLDLPEASRASLERAALGCPVHRSLSPETEIPVVFEWGAD
jgi:putative redox protein